MRLQDRVFSRRKRLGFWTVTILVCCLSPLGALWLELSQAQHAFRQQSSLIHETLSQRLASLDVILVSLVGLHHASDALNSAQLSAFTQELLESYPYISPVMLLTYTPQNQRASFVESMRESGLPQFDITELSTNGKRQSATLRFSYMPIQAIEPFGPLSAMQLGYDVASEPQLASAINRRHLGHRRRFRSYWVHADQTEFATLQGGLSRPLHPGRGQQPRPYCLGAWP